MNADERGLHSGRLTNVSYERGAQDVSLTASIGERHVPRAKARPLYLAARDRGCEWSEVRTAGAAGSNARYRDRHRGGRTGRGGIRDRQTEDK